jgi:hypothetical protein
MNVHRRQELTMSDIDSKKASCIIYSILRLAKASGLLVGKYLPTYLNELANKLEYLTHPIPCNFKQYYMLYFLRRLSLLTLFFVQALNSAVIIFSSIKNTTTSVVFY